VLAADSPWCDDVLTEPIEDCSTIIEQALEAALAELNAEHGDPADWRWGEAHRAVMEHPLLGRVPLAGSLFGIEVPTGGDGSTVNVGHFAMMPGAPFANTHAASFRGLYDLADLAESRFVIPSGQSGHPLSPHFADLTTLWAAGRTIRIAGGSGGRLELRPLNP
jgi:penicillin amidase